MPHARNPDEPLLVGIAMQRLRRQFKRRPDVRVAARTQSRRAATRWNCSTKVAQAIQTKARRQSCRTHAIPTSRYSLELLCRGCAGNSNEGQTSELPHARNHDEPRLVGIATSCAPQHSHAHYMYDVLYFPGGCWAAGYLYLAVQRFGGSAPWSGTSALQTPGARQHRHDRQ